MGVEKHLPNAPWVAEKIRHAKHHRTMTIDGRQYVICPDARKCGSELGLLPFNGHDYLHCHGCDFNSDQSSPIADEPGERQWL